MKQLFIKQYISTYYFTGKRCEIHDSFCTSSKCLNKQDMLEQLLIKVSLEWDLKKNVSRFIKEIG